MAEQWGYNPRIERAVPGSAVAFGEPWGEAETPPGSTYPIYAPAAATTEVPVTGTGSTEAAATPFNGSSLNTLYGVDSESYLTDDQRKLARMIQGKFDASMNRRDRALAQYGAPRLSSFVEDEALARAMSLARGLNYSGVDPLTGARAATGGAVPRSSGGGGGYGGGGGGSSGYRPGSASGTVPRYPTTPTTKPSTGAPASSAAKWQQITQGLSSMIPLLFGKDAYGQLLNKGLVNSVKDWLFGPGSTVNDRVFEQMVTSGAFPDAGGFQVNPFTGMPIAPMPGYGGYGGETYPDVYGPGSGWGEDVIPGAGIGSGGYWGDDGYWYPSAAGAEGDPFGVGGWDDGWGSGGDVGYWDAGYWYPDAGDAASWFDAADPFAIGGW